MAEKWTNGDSARQMTHKYNQAIEEINSMSKNSNNYQESVDADLKAIYEKLEQKVDTETAKKDLELDKVDNTPDKEKPVSEPQGKAIEQATQDMLTSVPSDMTELSPDAGVLINFIVRGTKLIMDTDTSQVVHKVNVFVNNNKLVFVSI